MSKRGFFGASLLKKILRGLQLLRAPPTEPRAGETAGPWTELEPLSALANTAVFAPHPDDESLGCGGLIARLRREGCRVRVIVVSDGSASHPGSHRFPPSRLSELRQAEARAAGSRLGLDPKADMDFMGLADGSVPSGPDVPGFDAAVATVAISLERHRIDTVIAPLRSDAHDDHRASFTIIIAAIATLKRPIRVLEYGVWAGGGRPGAPPELPQQLLRRYRLDVTSVLRQKKAAIRCHRSQLTDLINDDPAGFRLSPRMVAYFTGRWEEYYESIL